MNKPYLDPFLRATVVLACLAFPVTIFLFTQPAGPDARTWVQIEFYHVLLGATVGLAFLAFYFSYKEFSISGKIGIHLMSLSFLMFSLLLFGQSVLVLGGDPLLVGTFGTHARLLFALFFLMGVLASTDARFGQLQRLRPAALNWATAAIVVVAAVYLLLLKRGIGDAALAGIAEVVESLNRGFHIATITLLAVAVLRLAAVYRRSQNPMALVLALGAGFAIESTFLFGISQAWQLGWWTAHGVVVLGLLVLTYGIVLVTHSREADQLLFDLAFSRQELERMRAEQAELEKRVERLNFLVSVSDSLRHEILNPHTVIAGNAHILLENGKLDEPQRRLLEAIERQSQRVVELMDRYRGVREKVEFQRYDNGFTVLIDPERSR